ncbi:MAG: universal stress protein, partial [Chloroflexi bacterium]|nr:universal stress protein [Chloroflexota bacterium]
CAIRGGPESQASIQRAIRLARETSEPLHFVYVVNLEFLTLTNIGQAHLVAEELRQMGEFILLMAQSKAEAQGVPAQIEIRQGDVLEQVFALCQELDASYVVLGRSKGHGDAISTDHLERFTGRIGLYTKAKVVLADPADEVGE